ncbi:hypothetical protein D9M68_762310 [compost metagenome]
MDWTVSWDELVSPLVRIVAVLALTVKPPWEVIRTSPVTSVESLSVVVSSVRVTTGLTGLSSKSYDCTLMVSPPSASPTAKLAIPML